MKETARKSERLLLALVLAMGFLFATSGTAYANEAVAYVEKSWDSAKAEVVSETKTAECTPITSSTTGISGWYVVNGNIESSKRLVVSGTANIVLADGAKLYLEDGINVPAGATLNIYSQSEGDSAGELYCDADTNDNAAIGANETSGDCGTINIHGGKVTADTKTKGEDAAGIGGGEEGNGGTVTIYGGIVKAYGGSVNDEGGAGIGGGDCDDGVGGNGGLVYIYGGDVTAQGGANAAGIGGGDDGGNGGLVYIYGGTVNATGGSVNSRGGAGIGGGGIGSGDWIEIYGGDVTAQGGANAAGIGGGDEGKSGAIRIYGGTVNATGGSDNYDGGAGIGGGNEAAGYDIFIYGGNVTAQGGCDAAGIGGGDDGEGTSIGINGADTIVNAIGGKYGAGIGGGQGKGSDKIYIRNGSVTAQGGANAAGIGGGESGAGGTITISGGTITATSVSDGAGIGGGDSGAGGTINISGGIVEATGGAYGAGIGGGDAANGGEINISSGTITATGGEDAAGIGGGEDGNGGTINITGGTITSSGGKNGAGIGGGQHGTGGTITINSATGELITAKSPEDGAGIGGGDLAGGGKITIENGKIKATGGSSHVIVPFDAYDFGGAGIGGGDGGDTGGSGPSGEITINGGDIEAQGGYSAAGIGAGKRSSCETVTITGGKIIAKGGTGTAFSTGRGGAGVGSGSLGSGSGAITISGGDVTATGGANAAGVGGGYEVAAGTINISGGKVSATGGAYKDLGSSSSWDGGAGAGIGGGQGKSGGTITISGGTIEATGGASENTKAAGIGGGQDAEDATNITLRYDEADYDISVKASSYRYSSEDTSVTLTMEKPFMDKDTREGFEAKSYTENNLDTFDNRTLVRANTYGVMVPEIQGGSIVPDKSRAVESSTVTLTVTPDAEGWELKSGTLKAVAGTTEQTLTQDTSDSSKYTFAMPASDVTVTADFELKVRADSISLNKKSATLAVDGSETLTVTALPEEANNEALPDTLTWTSSDESVATVDDAGKVTGVAPGTATITVTTNNGTEDTTDDKSDTCTVTVTQAQVAAPAIDSKPYTGEKQVADVPESKAYTVTTNEGGTDVGSYSVVLTLADPTKYKWADSDDAVKTLTFEITKAVLDVTVPELAAVTYDPAKTLANVPLPEGWAWANSATVPTVGNSGYRAVLAVDDTNYDCAGVEGYDAANHKVTRTVPLTVTKATVATPEIASKAYTGETQTADVPASDLYTVTENEGGTEPGTYDVVLTLKDPANYAWEGVEGPTVTLGFVIRECEHDWNEPIYTWNEDNTKVTAKRVCKKDASHVETETVDVTSEVTKEPAGDELGVRTYTSGPFANPAFTVQTKTETISAEGHAHSWTEPTYEWAADNMEVRASRALTNDPSFVEVETVTPIVTDVNPKCTEAGTRTYTASFKNIAFATQTRTSEIPATGHAAAAPLRESEVAATCEKAGSYDEVVYCSACGAELSRVAKAIDPLGHDWGDPAYEWAADNGSVTATLACKRDASHVETETAETTSAVTKEPTEAEEGARTYTATFANPAFETQAKTEPIPKLEPDGGVSYRSAEGDGLQWTRGSSATADFTFKRSVDDDATFSHFTGIQVDGEDVDAANYTAEPGSVIVKLKPAYLETLAVGEHTLTAMFDDAGSVDARFEVLAAPAAKGAASKANSASTNSASANSASAKTGDAMPVALLASLAVLSVAALIVAGVANRARRSAHVGKHARL
ncbi:Ig-like domain-containing protein [Denitrobacterium detoxificans]|uniref:Ig-like domain (Group 2) n=1 Tax=Denitrobacterium detoxificans TaxID=79604 RepID=A0A1H8RY06_9ACTN|nr:Ig-like domain-containing protein [Denitrobacterium detoxificans]SEO71331.1 Ig-like domain (group 2) [Denitrobacterium detoxificans]